MDKKAYYSKGGNLNRFTEALKDKNFKKRLPFCGASAYVKLLNGKYNLKSNSYSKTTTKIGLNSYVIANTSIL
ncbi:hypothetical protein CIB87_16785 [Priestia megaterium]|uniref:Uncharacterized protein n=1 Tax=Priestia megaterium TaxID=1404 RepID=A0AA86LWS6_PRIMG|nr:hypothetical protein CIB87_16785 [Priestia megaterium]